MRIKVCYENEIHKFPEMPDTFNELIQRICRAFTQLPTQWILKYYDPEGDKIHMNCEKDYEEFMGLELQNNNSSARLLIVADSSAKSIVTAECHPDISQNQEVQEIEENKEEKEVSTFIEVEYISMKEKESIINFTDRIKEVTEVLIREDNILQSSISQKEQSNLSDMFSAFKSVESISIISESQVKKKEAMNTALQMVDALKDHLIGVFNQGGELNPHYGVNCNHCNATPIQGIRYKCTECLDFNLCAKCERTQEHEHDFVKMKPRNRLDIKSQIVPSE